MRLTVLALALLLASPALATQEYILPTLFDVTDVAADDVLNIRAEPSASAAIIGQFVPDQTGIEVIEERDGWGRVNSGEGSGWVSMRYLSYRTDVWQAGMLPASFACAGTEPFWGLSVQQSRAILGGPDMDETPRRISAVLGGDIFRDPSRAILAEGLTASVVPQICSDGMSDRLFGLRASVILHGDQPRLLQGCCSVQP
ncbi:SH3 domain-containing protein [Paracoccus sp. M683]|uniref:SH3 domain-containing protein n=1 Tax=Paracoccus sp. M683 TaxID=2594268 RepID=UPI00163DAF7B|nr:SH3 domain-containing protein [Paracoccus sp. M683]